MVKVLVAKARAGCTTQVWVGFRVPSSERNYSYHDPHDLLGGSSAIGSPIGYLNSRDATCSEPEWRVGDTIELAYVPSDPSLNRPYYGKLSRGIAPEEWKFNAAISAAVLLFVAWAGIWSSRRSQSTS